MFQTSVKTRMRVGLTLLSWAFAAWLPGGAVANGQEPATIVRVEEDWELVVNIPDSNTTAPQICCYISPTSDLNSFYSTFELNHQSQPEFLAGGLHLHVWDNEVLLTEYRFSDNASMSEDNETVTWTQTMTLVDNQLDVEVINGASTTWGAFGTQGEMKVSVLTNLSNLNAYSPDLSASNSGIAYAAHRVHSLVLKRVRYITSTGEVVEDNSPRNVHTTE